MCSPPCHGRSWGERHGVGWMCAGGCGWWVLCPPHDRPWGERPRSGQRRAGAWRGWSRRSGGAVGVFVQRQHLPMSPHRSRVRSSSTCSISGTGALSLRNKSMRGEGAARACAAGSGVLWGGLAASWTTAAPSSPPSSSCCCSSFCSSSCWQCADSAGSFHQRDCGRPVGAREARRRARARGARGGSARFEPDPVAAATGGDSAGWP